MKKLLFYCMVLLGLGSCHQGRIEYFLSPSKESVLKEARRSPSIYLQTNLDTFYSKTMTQIPLYKLKNVSIWRTDNQRPYDTILLNRLIGSKYIKESRIDLTFYAGKLNELDMRSCELPNIDFVSLSQSGEENIDGKRYYDLKKINPLNFEKVTFLSVNVDNEDLDWSIPVPWDYFSKIERLNWTVKYSCLKKRKEQIFPDEIVQLSALKSLSFWSNCSHNENVEYLSLPKTIAELQNLESLYLYNYIFNSLPEEIGALEKLRGLHLNHFKAERFPREVFGLEQLRFFSYTNSQLDTFPIELLKLKELGVLELSHTDLEVLPETLGEDLPRLHSLNLEHNKLKELPKDIGEQCPELFDLNLSHNEMVSFPVEVTKIKQLYYLNLSHNQITSLPKELIKLRGKLRYLNLKGNPIPSKEIEVLRKKMPNVNITF
jgi:Leucine-rich repeat (LRR) protein